MLDRNEDTELMDSERVRLEGDRESLNGVAVSAMAMLIVLLTPARGVVLPPLAEGSPSVDSKIISYWPLAVEPLDGVWKIVLSYSSMGGRIDEAAEGV